MHDPKETNVNFYTKCSDGCVHANDPDVCPKQPMVRFIRKLRVSHFLDVEFWTFPRCHRVCNFLDCSQCLLMRGHGKAEWTHPFICLKRATHHPMMLWTLPFWIQIPKSTWVAFYILNAPHEAFSSRLPQVVDVDQLPLQSCNCPKQMRSFSKIKLQW